MFLTLVNVLRHLANMQYRQHSEHFTFILVVTESVLCWRWFWVWDQNYTVGNILDNIWYIDGNDTVYINAHCRVGLFPGSVPLLRAGISLKFKWPLRQSQIRFYYTNLDSSLVSCCQAGHVCRWLAGQYAAGSTAFESWLQTSELWCIGNVRLTLRLGERDRDE